LRQEKRNCDVKLLSGLSSTKEVPPERRGDRGTTEAGEGG